MDRVYRELLIKEPRFQLLLDEVGYLDWSIIGKDVYVALVEAIIEYHTPIYFNRVIRNLRDYFGTIHYSIKDLERLDLQYLIYWQCSYEAIACLVHLNQFLKNSGFEIRRTKLWYVLLEVPGINSSIVQWALITSLVEWDLFVVRSFKMQVKIQKFFSLDYIPNNQDVELLLRHLKPYRTVFYWYLWYWYL